MRRGGWKRKLSWLLAGLALLLLLAAAAAWLFARASLPQLDGVVQVPGMNGTVTVQRDAYGVPLIRGANRQDIAYVTGYIHAQDRFFQMDLLRRTAAGELAELFGEKALPLDRANRLHRFRARAEQLISAMPPEDRHFLERYVSGVNDGLFSLGARPFEYGVIRSRPAAWLPADSLLVAWAMYFDLQGKQESRELARGWIRDHSSDAQRDFLLPEYTQWDSPLDASQPNVVAAPVPDKAPAWWGKAVPGEVAALFARHQPDDAASVGSNNFAIGGSRNATRSAIVANDMHLGLRLPNIWYRVALQFPDLHGKDRQIVGLTLPGAPPLVVVGSNGNVAWGFTNSYGDYVDLVEAAVDPSRPGMAKVGKEWERVAETVEIIYVNGEEPRRMIVRETSFGPLRTVGDKLYAVRWVAHSPGALNLNTRWLEMVDTLDGALAVANTMGIPAQNFVAGDRAGNIGWTIAGILPQRVQNGIASTFPMQPGDPHAWREALDPSAYPRVVNPPTGQLSTANNRQLDGHPSTLIGDGGFDLGARATQLRNGLLALGADVTVQGAHDAMLDDRAHYMAHWRERALRSLDSDSVRIKRDREHLRNALKMDWSGRASVDSTGYRIARDYMWALYAVLFEGLDAELAKIDREMAFSRANPRWSVVIARLLDEQPAGWLPPGYASWKDVSLAAIDRVIAQRREEAARAGVFDGPGDNGNPFAGADWGERNTIDIRHPMASALPLFRPWLAAPPDQVPGDSHMPRVSGPSFGQSERLVVIPGKERDSVFAMPGGQSGHPLSPYFMRGHEEWVKGRYLPLMPGPAEHTLTFTRPGNISPAKARPASSAAR